MFNVFIGGLLFTVVGFGIALILIFFVLLPFRQKHDYWCHRDRIPVGEDHGNQEPHVL
jgi:ABC-type antimicrobial peptide transport system permease subunit